ncbi:hypothetical protein [Saccharopolyspora antimicrobica]|uniref:hypothetical protein n=1 Tax=Saccharopolyspora antimicrobica TaxID=455193 RepID=UPI001160AA32|nr:hypothetical protein [Saccharopolyspora antimicrobica]
MSAPELCCRWRAVVEHVVSARASRAAGTSAVLFGGELPVTGVAGIARILPGAEIVENERRMETNARL